METGSDMKSELLAELDSVLQNGVNMGIQKNKFRSITLLSLESEVLLKYLWWGPKWFEGFEKVGSRTENLPNRYHYATETVRNTAGICPSFSEHKWNRTDLIDVSRSNLPFEWVAGGMISSIPDLLKFAISLRDGKLLSTSSMELLRTTQSAGDYFEIGHVIFRFQSPRGYGNRLGHNGSVLRFDGSRWWNEETDCIVCVLANVGTVHAAKVQSSATEVVFEYEFLEIAAKLADLMLENAYY